jgi:hypothetical protein
MVHALKEIGRVLVPGGSLIDFRPVGAKWPMEILDGEQVRLAGMVDRKLDIRDDAACSESLAQVVGEGWFVQDHEQFFDYYEYWDGVDETHGPVVVPDAVLAEARRLLAASREGAKVRIHYQTVMSR